MTREDLQSIAMQMPEFAGRDDIVRVFVVILSLYRLNADQVHEVLQLAMNVMEDVDVNPENHEYVKLFKLN